MSVELRLALQEQRSADLAERVRRLLGPFTGNEAALDAGCGTGSISFALAPHVAEVVGVDTREDYLDAARAAAPANVRFQQADVMSLPFGYAEFDLVCCHRVLHHVRRPELAVSELARVARPGGKIFIADQLGSIDPMVNLEQDRFEHLRDATHQRLLPEADIRGFLDANDLVLLSSEVTREKVDLEQRLELGGLRRGGAESASVGLRLHRRTRSRSAGTSPASRASSSPSRCSPARRATRREKMPGTSACPIACEAVREPRHRDLDAALVDGSHDRPRDVVGLDDVAPQHRAPQLRPLREALRLDEPRHHRVDLNPLLPEECGGRAREGELRVLRRGVRARRSEGDGARDGHEVDDVRIASAARSPGANARRHQTPPR